MNIRNLIALSLFMNTMLPAYAGVTVTDAWIKVTAPGQTAAEAYMYIKSDTPARLVGVSSPAAKIAQIHEMRMNGNVMQMRTIHSLDLPAGKTLQFKPDGYHIMLAEISPPLKPGVAIPLTLIVEGSDMQRRSIDVKAEARGAMTMEKKGNMQGM